MSDTIAGQIAVLSAGAVKPALVKIAERFRRETAHDLRIEFATAPEIRKRVAGGEKPDVLIAPPEVLEDLIGAATGGSSERVVVGRIGIGVMVRSGAPVPAIETVAEFKETLLNAKALFYNRASTGLYLESLFERLGIADELKDKTTRYPDAGPVLDRMSKADDGNIGFGATTVIVESESRGLKFVGPLPPEIQHYTTYAAEAVFGRPNNPAAKRLVHYLTTPEAKAVLAQAGID
jgi:molybdate transport system substrate-binding protein